MRAFTLFSRAYDATRGAVTYLRWNEGDADDIAPSLYKGREGRSASTGGAATPPPEKPPEAGSGAAGGEQPGGG